MDSDNTFLMNKCKEYEVDYKLARKLKAKFFPILEEAHKKLGYRFDQALVEQKGEADIRLVNSSIVILLLRKLNPQQFSEKERKIVSLHLEYLSLVEGFFATQVNFVVFTLIANGHDLYSTFHGKYVEKLTDIAEVQLAFKLKFLRRHGFKTVANIPNLKLRNSVAHLFYYLHDDGTISFGKNKITPKEYSKLYDKLRNVSFGLHLVTLTYYRRFA